MTIPTLVFDYDGTLHETMHVYEPAFRESYEWLITKGYAQRQEVSSQRISSWLGMNAVDMWEDFQPDLPVEIRMQASHILGERMLSLVREHKARWYSGVRETLDELKEQGYPMVILSNSKISTGQTHWEEFRMEQWFAHWYDCETYDWAPKTEIIKVIQRQRSADLIVIGDRESDLEGAVAAGAPFIGCAYGYGSETELQGAAYLLQKPAELLDAIRFCRRIDEGTQLSI